MGKLGLKEQLGDIWTNGSRLNFKVKETIFSIRMAWQRAWKGYDDSMWWGLDSSFYSLYSKLLTELKEKSHGHPLGMEVDEWEAILEEMIYHIKQCDSLTHNICSDEDGKGYEYHKQEFFKLFIKHLEELWD